MDESPATPAVEADNALWASDPDALLQAMAPGLSQRGFLTTQVDKLVAWAQTGSLWP